MYDTGDINTCVVYYFVILLQGRKE